MKTKTALNGLKIGILSIALSFASCEENENFDQEGPDTIGQ